MFPLRVHPTERGARWPCPPARSIHHPSGKRKQRTFRVAFGTDRAVETKQEVLKKIFHYTPVDKGIFLCRSEFAGCLRRHQGRIQSCRSKTEAEYLHRRPQVSLGGQRRKSSRGPLVSLAHDKPGRTVEPGVLYPILSFKPSHRAVHRGTGCGRLRQNTPQSTSTDCNARSLNPQGPSTLQTPRFLSQEPGMDHSNKMYGLSFQNSSLIRSQCKTVIHANAPFFPPLPPSSMSNVMSSCET
jgi:hypothetical protein